MGIHTLKSSSLTEEEVISIKGGVNAQNAAFAFSCTACNCWFGNENKQKPTTPIKKPSHTTE